MPTVPLSFRVPDLLVRRMRALRAYVAHSADVPCDPEDVTMTDIAARALATGVEIIERSREHDIASLEFSEPTRDSG